MFPVRSSCRSSPFTRVVSRTSSSCAGSVKGTSQGPIAPDASQFLPCVTLNLACRTQSRIVPSLQRVSAAMWSSVRLRDAPAAPADHHRHLALVVQLLAFRRPDQRVAVAGETAGKRGKRDMGLGGASCPSLYSALRSGKLTPTQMIFSGGRGIGDAGTRPPRRVNRARDRAARAIAPAARPPRSPRAGWASRAPNPARERRSPCP